jgi:hypothetical protein
MREAIFILVILLLLFGLTAYRYRRQIKFALEIWRTMKGVREIQSKAKHSDPIEPPAAKGELVNCGRCGKWTPISTSIKFGPTIYYCSTNCLQTKAKS